MYNTSDLQWITSWTWLPNFMLKVNMLCIANNVFHKSMGTDDLPLVNNGKLAVKDA